MGISVGPLRGGTGAANAEQPPPAALAEPPASEPVQSEPSGDRPIDLPAAPELAHALRDTLRERLGYEVAGDSLSELVKADLSDVELSTIVVSLPDPRHGRHARYFDQGIDALRRGASAHNLEQLSFVLPSVGKTANSDAACDKSVPGRSCPDGAKPKAEPEPYFILFGQDSLLVVALLVLESPVQGPRVGNLWTSLTIADALQTRKDRVRLLSPFFSGSAQTLSAQLKRLLEHRREPFGIDVVTGTATQATIGSVIARHGETSFRRTTPSDEDVIAFLLDELGRRDSTRREGWQGRQKVALLSEFDTTFGDAIVHVGSSQRMLPRTQMSRRPTLNTFGYPSSISELRTIRQTQAKGRQSEDDPLSLRRTLHLVLDPAARDPDIPPLLSQITPFERELELAEQLTGICRERYDYLVLTATDPLDLVFLAEESRKYCPGLPLVALGAEKIFRHPDVRGALDGLLIAGSYPLLAETPPWAMPGERAFSSHVTQGFYNAWITLLNEVFPSEPAPLVDYHPPSGSKGAIPASEAGGQQPVWLTTLAGGSFWPLRSGSVHSPEAVHPGAEDPDRARLLHARVTGPVRIAGVLLLGLALAHIVWMSRREMRALRADPLGARYRLGMNFTLFLLLALALPPLLHAQSGTRGARALVYGSCVAAISTFLVLLAYHAAMDARRLINGLRAWGAWDRHRRAGSVSTIALLGFCLLFLVVATQWLVEYAVLGDVDRQMTLTRMYNLVGISPFAPIAYLAAAYYTWSFIGLCRVRALVRFTELAPLPRRGDRHLIAGQSISSDSTLTPALEDVLSNLRGAWSSTLYGREVFAVSLAALAGGWFWLRVKPTWETPAYDWLLKLGMAVLYALVVVASVHFLTLVSLLRRFLRQLAALPMVDSYDRVAIKMKSSFGIQFGVRVPAFEELQLSGFSSTLLQVLMDAETAKGRPRADASASEASKDAVDASRGAAAERAGGRPGPSTHDSNRPGPSALPPHQGGEPLPPAYQSVFDDMVLGFEERSAEVAEALRAFRHADGRPVEIEQRGHRALYQASQTLFVTLRKLWAVRARSPVTDELNKLLDPKTFLSGGDLAELPTVSLYAGAVPPRVLLWMRVAEDFVTLRIATFLSHVMTHLRYLLAFTLSASLLLILAVSSYPLEPTRFVTVFSWTLMLGVIALAFIVIVRMERNEVLSRLSGSTPGKIDFNFALAGQLVVYVGLPLLAVLANIFPEIRDQLFAWVGPVRRLLQ